MKKIRLILAAVITLSLVAGYGSVQTEKTVSAAGKNKNITIKAASDFTLKLPAEWKNNYVKESSKGKKHGSYMVFSAKKCYNETGEGFLFSIAKYEDESYQELPVYELVGKWNGVSYVAEFPTDVQIVGATKKAAKQYQTLNKSVEKVVRSIGR